MNNQYFLVDEDPGEQVTKVLLYTGCIIRFWHKVKTWLDQMLWQIYQKLMLSEPIKLNRKFMNNQYFLVDEDPGEQVTKLLLYNFRWILVEFI